ncbi:MAG: 6-carboxytetrahydropterin synthase QueD [Candidatus Fermentibacteraceae bacterium]|nr:6-carboxytetrahydropterin synthase QueD [Candidatus Fermentibacteraceae bacterium]
MEIYREFKFDAAHSLNNLAEGHKCRNLHGHTFAVIVYVSGPVGEKTGWVMDYGEIKSICGPVIDQLDHSYLNDIPGLEIPTSETIAVWIWNRIKPEIPSLSMVEVKETAATGCRYTG